MGSATSRQFHRIIVQWHNHGISIFKLYGKELTERFFVLISTPKPKKSGFCHEFLSGTPRKDGTLPFIAIPPFPFLPHPGPFPASNQYPYNTLSYFSVYYYTTALFDQQLIIFSLLWQKPWAASLLFCQNHYPTPGLFLCPFLRSASPRQNRCPPRR